MPEVVVAFGDRRKQIRESAAHREIVLVIERRVVERVPRGVERGELLVEQPELSVPVCRLRKLKDLTVALRDDEETLAVLRYAESRSVEHLIAEPIVALRALVYQ